MHQNKNTGMLKISIPEPCHEDWSKMSPNEQGRHCGSCAKTVVDFTAMSDDEVKHFFISKKNERVCGRFQQKQLDQIVIDLPANIFYIEMPLWKKFLVASLVVFSTTLFSCNTSIDGQLTQNGQPLELLNHVANHIEPESRIMVGGLTIVRDTTPPPPPTCNTTKGLVAQINVAPKSEHLMGDTAIILPVTTKPNEPVTMGLPVLIHPKKDTAIHLMGKPSIDRKDCDKDIYQ